MKQPEEIKLDAVRLSSILKCFVSKKQFSFLRFRINLFDPSGFGTRKMGEMN